MVEYARTGGVALAGIEVAELAEMTDDCKEVAYKLMTSWWDELNGIVANRQQ